MDIWLVCHFQWLLYECTWNFNEDDIITMNEWMIQMKRKCSFTTDLTYDEESASYTDH